MKEIKISETKMPETVGEDGAEIIVIASKASLDAQIRGRSRKRKAVMPNRDGVDRWTVISQSDSHIEVDCRFLYRDMKPENNVRVRIPLPNRKNIEAQLKANVKKKDLENAVDRWLQEYVRKAVMQHRRRRQKQQKRLFNEMHIGEFEQI